LELKFITIKNKTMQTLQELKKQFDIKGKFSDPELVFKRVKNLPEILDMIDFDVYLPSIKENLQRPYVWVVEQERELINSILIGRYIPPIRYVSLINPNGSMLDLIQVIDGKQRLSAIIRFLQDKFTIEIGSKEFLYSELPIDFKSEIDNFLIRGQAMYQQYNEKSELIPITDESKIKWFCLINFSETKQHEDHMNNLKKQLNNEKRRTFQKRQ
jgi:alpha-acetolactate decarboxylase